MAVSIYRYADNTTPASHDVKMQGGRKKADEAKENQSGNVSANDLLVGTIAGDASDKALALKQKGARNSLKTLLDQFTTDLKTDAQIEGLTSDKQDLADKLGDYKDQRDKNTAALDQLKDDYMIDDDSEEEANLNLLRKQRDDPASLTGEEQEQLANMGEMTDYQKDALTLDEAVDYWGNLADSTQESITDLGKTVDSIKLERLKSSPMLSAKKQAEEIKKASIEEAAGVLMDDAVENVKEAFGGDEDEDNDKVNNKDKKDGDKTAAEEETDQTASNTNNVTVSDAQIDAALSMEEKQKQLLAKMKSLMQTQPVTTEDLMGIQVDTSL